MKPVATLYTSDNMKYEVASNTPFYQCSTTLEIPSEVRLEYSSKDVQYAINFCYGRDATSQMTLPELSTATSIALYFGMDGYYRKVISSIASRIDGKSTLEIRNILAAG